MNTRKMIPMPNLELHKALKIEAAKRETSVIKLVEAVLKEYLTKKKIGEKIKK